VRKPMKVVKTVEIEVPGLGGRIKGARLDAQRKGKTLTKIAAEAGMSAQNWYRIEQEKQALPEETLILIEKVLETKFGVAIDE